MNTVWAIMLSTLQYLKLQLKVSIIIQKEEEIFAYLDDLSLLTLSKQVWLSRSPATE